MSATPRARRRLLQFRDFDDILREVDDCSRGYSRAGNWDLAQICRHLADTFQGSIQGLNLSHHRWKRRLLGKLLLRATYRKGIPFGFTVDPALTPPPGLDFASERARLERALAGYRAYSGPLQPHPLFGRLNRPQWDRLHLFHAAHHLSYLIPEAAADNS